jgi:archaellum component FlaC
MGIITDWQAGYDEGRRMGTKHMYAEVDRLKAENKRLNGTIQHMIDQTIPLVPDENNPMWSRRITIDELQAEVEALRKDAELGQVATRYIDRLCDPTESDSLEKIVDEYAAAFRQGMSKGG